MSALRPQRIVLLGSKGMLGQMIKTVVPSCYHVTALDRSHLELSAHEFIEPCLKKFRPEIIINCAAKTAVDRCEEDREGAFQLNAALPGHLASAAKAIGARLVHVSTDYVFDGTATSPYREDDLPEPLSVYGRSKFEGEQQIVDSGLKDWLIVRTSWLYGPWGNSFPKTILELAVKRTEISVVDDQIGTPTFTGDLAKAIFSLLDTDAAGIVNFSNDGSCSWYEFACALIKEARSRGASLNIEKILPILTNSYPLPAARPAYSVLSKEKYKKLTGATVPHWEEGLARYFEFLNEEISIWGDQCSR